MRYELISSDRRTDGRTDGWTDVKRCICLSTGGLKNQAQNAKIRPTDTIHINPSHLDTHQPCHAITGLTIIVVVETKECLVGNSPAKPSFGMTPTIIIVLYLYRLYFIVGCHTKRSLGRAGASQTFFWNDNNKNPPLAVL